MRRRQQLGSSEANHLTALATLQPFAERLVTDAEGHVEARRCMAGLLAWEAAVRRISAMNVHYSAGGSRATGQGYDQVIRRLDIRAWNVRQRLREHCLTSRHDLTEPETRRLVRSDVSSVMTKARAGQCAAATYDLLSAATWAGRGGLAERPPGDLMRAIRAFNGRCVHRGLATLPKASKAPTHRELLEIDGARSRRRRRR